MCYKKKSPSTITCTVVWGSSLGWSARIEGKWTTEIVLIPEKLSNLSERKQKLIYLSWGLTIYLAVFPN